jgi:hypothetical protein
MPVESTDDPLSSTDIIPPPGIDFEKAEPEAFNDTADDLPMLSNSMRIDGPITPAPSDDTSEAGKTLAVGQQSRTGPAIPDLDALQTAINAARGGEQLIDKTDTHLPELNMSAREPAAETEQEPVAELAPAPEPEPEPEPELIFEHELDPEPVPETESAPVPEPVVESEPDITLDKSLDQSLEDQRLEGQKLDKMAAELANIDSIEDVSDIMAETLFGIEFEQIAQEALKNPPAAGTLPGESDDVLAESAMASSETSIPANDPGEEPSPVMLDTESEEPVKEPTVSVPAPQSLPEPDQGAHTRDPSAAPESIENQFQTEITQTMKTIDPANLPNPELDDDDESEKSGGLFGRLKKTFRG